MSAAEAFRAAMLSHAPLSAAVHGVIAHNAAPGAAALPFIVFREERDISQTLDGSVVSTRSTFSADVWAANPVTADQVADLLEAACTAVDAAGDTSVTVLSRSTQYDPDTKEDGVALAIEWWP